jgi:DNA-binding CsgD family transcriptional regulator
MPEIERNGLTPESDSKDITPTDLEKRAGRRLSFILKLLHTLQINREFESAFRYACLLTQLNAHPAFMFALLVSSQYRARYRYFEVSSVHGLSVVKFNEEARNALNLIANITKMRMSESETFQYARKTFLPLEQNVKPLERNLNEQLSKEPDDPIYSFLISMLYLICERRLWRRYLRSRFGLKRLLQPKEIKLPTDPYEYALCISSLESLTEIEVQFYSYLQTFDLAALKWQECSPFDLQKFLSEILGFMGSFLRDFRLYTLEQRMLSKEELSDSGNIELANLAAFFEANLDFSPNAKNRRLAKAVEIYGEKEVREQIAGNVHVVLSEKEIDEPFSAGTGGKSALSRMAQLLEAKGEDLHLNFEPLEARHENLADSNTDNFALLQEVRQELRYQFERAKLTPSEIKCLLLQQEGMTESEIAQIMGKAIGTVRSWLARAKKKLQNLKESNPH